MLPNDDSVIEDGGLPDIREEQLRSAEYLKPAEDSQSPATRKSLKKLAHAGRQRPKTALHQRRELARNPSSKYTKVDSQAQFDDEARTLASEASLTH